MPTTMIREIRDAWANALESGEYLQGGGHLRREVPLSDGSGKSRVDWCCLGVLCDLALKADLPGLRLSPADGYGYFEDRPESESSMGVRITAYSAFLPPSVVRWATGEDSRYAGCHDILLQDGAASVLNDNGVPFQEIARQIRELPVREETEGSEEN